MNLSVALTLYGGGPGSGCTGPNCGRPATGGGGSGTFGTHPHEDAFPAPVQIPHVPDVVKKPPKPRDWKTNPRRAGGYFQKGAAVGQIFEELEKNQGQWMEKGYFADKHQLRDVQQRINVIKQVGKMKGKWDVQELGDEVRLVMKNKPDQPIAQEDQPKPIANDPDLEEARLLTGKITNKFPNGGGANESWTLNVDGIKAKFKVESKMATRDDIPAGLDAEREVAAWKVAKLVGMDDMVPTAVVRKLDGQKGSLTNWAPGQDAANSRKPFDSNADRDRAAAFDYVTGHEDRHTGNWVLDSNNKMHLIDNGLSFPENSGYKTYRLAFIGDAAKDGSGSKPPSQLAGPYVANADKIGQELVNLGFNQKVRDGVQARIVNLGKFNSWETIKNKVQRY